MDKNDNINKSIEIVKGYLKELENNNININKAVLFGSAAKGTNDFWSDIDVLVVSEIFNGNKIEDKDKIRKITVRYNSDISPLPFNPRDFDTSNLFIKEILETGIQII